MRQSPCCCLKPPEPPFRRTNSVAFALGHGGGLEAFADEKQTSGAAGIERARMKQGGAAGEGWRCQTSGYGLTAGSAVMWW